MFSYVTTSTEIRGFFWSAAGTHIIQPSGGERTVLMGDVTAPAPVLGCEPFVRPSSRALPL